jgi:hypothetical protein
MRPSIRHGRQHVAFLIMEKLKTEGPVCTENLIRVDAVMESPKLAE